MDAPFRRAVVVGIVMMRKRSLLQYAFIPEVEIRGKSRFRVVCGATKTMSWLRRTDPSMKQVPLLGYCEPYRKARRKPYHLASVRGFPTSALGCRCRSFPREQPLRFHANPRRCRIPDRTADRPLSRETPRFAALYSAWRLITLIGLTCCCTVLRRAKRRIVSVALQEEIAPHLLAYLNRASDLLFVLARVVIGRQRCFIAIALSSSVNRGLPTGLTRGHF